MSNEQSRRVDSKLGRSLFVIATAQLMFVLDEAIANIALPSIQRDLGVSASDLPWIINAYVLAFGGLLLFGGRLGDLFGRRRTFRIGLGVFTLASLLGGLGVNVEMLISSRALQGLGAALAAPNALALIATTFPTGKPRNKAMAVYGAMSAVGITAGLLLGGLLTGLLSWRWVFFINIPLGLVVLAGSGSLAQGERNTGSLDTPGAVTGTGGIVALAYGITRGGEHAWSDPVTLGAFVLAVVFGLLFLWIESRRENPMLPLSLFRDRNRSGAYAAVLFIGAGLMGSFYLLTLYLQQVLQFGPIATGLSSLPFSAGIILSAGTSSKLVERFAPRVVAGPGLILAAGGMYWLSTLGVDTSYPATIMPALFVTSFGLGLSFVPMTLTPVQDVAEDRAGVASALVNMSQQVGAAIGLSVFTTISVTASDSRVPDAAEALRQAMAKTDPTRVTAASEALAHGYSTAFLVGAGMLVVAAVIVIASITSKRTQSGTGSTLAH